MLDVIKGMRVTLPVQATMPISAQQWRVSVGLFNCSRMRWLLKGGGAKKTPAPSPSMTSAHAVKRGVRLLLYLMAIACVMPPRLLLIQSGDVELNPGPVEGGKQWEAEGVLNVPRWQLVCKLFYFLSLPVSDSY